MLEPKLDLVVDAIRDAVRELEELDETFELYGTDKVIRKLRAAEFELLKELELVKANEASK